MHRSEGAAAILRAMFAGLDREQFLICGLDAKHKLIGIDVVSTPGKARRKERLGSFMVRDPSSLVR